MPTKLAKEATWNQAVKEVTVKSGSCLQLGLYIPPRDYTSEYKFSWVTEKIR